MTICDTKHQVFTERLNGMDRALAIRAADLERRLEGLNQLRQEVVRDREMFLNKEVYNTKTAFYDGWCSEVNDRLTKIETRSIVWTSAIVLIFTIVEILVRMVK